MTTWVKKIPTIAAVLKNVNASKILKSTPLPPEIVNGLFALGGALIGSGAPLLTNWINKRAEDRRHQRDIATKAALESWRVRLENHRIAGPLEHQILYTALMIELSTERNLTPEKLQHRLNEISRIVDVMQTHSREAGKTTG